jgi:hypothetical protein
MSTQLANSKVSLPSLKLNTTTQLLHCWSNKGLTVFG